MKKLLLLCMSLLICLSSTFAQSKQPIKRQKSTKKTIVKKNESEIIKEKSLKWFKAEVVEKYFKDPYSFKLMKQMITPLKCKEFLENILAEAKYSMDTTTVAEEDRNATSAQDCDNYYNKCLDRCKVLKKSSDIYDQKRLAVEIEYARKYALLEHNIRLYLLAKKQHESTESKIASLDSVQAEEIICYKIQIDCYSKNGLGNEVLGRFVFQFGKDGNPLPWSLSTIKNLND